MRIIAIFVWLMAFTAGSQGWNDFSIDLGRGLVIHRLSGLGCVLCKQNGDMLVGDERGYIEDYAETDSCVAVRCLADQQEQYFLVRRADFSVVGPLSESALLAQPELTGVSLEWKRPVRRFGFLFFFICGAFVVIFLSAVVIRFSDAWRAIYATGKRRVPDEIMDNSP